MADDTNKPLTEAEKRRLERFERSRQNRRGRKKPAPVPARLARTSAFAPKRRNLITDSTFHRIYVVPGQSVIEVMGRELGSQHRDAIYAIFRLKPRRLPIQNPDYPRAGQPRFTYIYETRATWRQLLATMGKTQHINNLLTLTEVFTDLKKVVLRVQEGNPDQILEQNRKGRLGGTSGRINNILHDIEWDGIDLDKHIRIQYGEWVKDTIEKTHLVSLNAEVQFKLVSDHAKSFWPYIDSQPDHTFVDEDMLAALAGRDLWNDQETSATRAQFRKDCKQAFEDMVRAQGLKSYTVKQVGAGRRKSRRYCYVHALPRQMEMDLF